jgi:hypothetical protein
MKLSFLVHTDQQRWATEALYENNKQICYVFEKGNKLDQQQAQAHLKALGLDRDMREHLESRWRIQWSNSWSVCSPGTKDDEQRHILFQW